MTADIFDNDFICRPGRAAVSDCGRRGGHALLGRLRRTADD
jgi:hypothetical protein